LKVKHIVIDLIPLLPGGANGGARIVALNLIQGFQTFANRSHTPWRFTLLVAPWNVKELEVYQSNSISCHLISDLTQEVRSLSDLFKKIRFKLSKSSFFPSLLHRLKADLLFCPFSNPSVTDSRIPCITIFHDLQHLVYPQFFSAIELKNRDQYLKRMLELSRLIICVSKFSQESLHHYLKVSPEKTRFIYNYFPSHFNASLDSGNDRLHLLPLQNIQYLLYPANYWPHKNHINLLRAYRIYLDQCTDTIPFHLALTGSLTDAETQLKTMVKNLDLDRYVHFLGYLDHSSLKWAWHHCKGLVFPSLYEGFGLPLVEAMSVCKPILCSKIPSLEEVGENACLYFDPSLPESIANQLLRFTLDHSLELNLINNGQVRLRQFQSIDTIEQYCSIFKAVL